MKNISLALASLFTLSLFALHAHAEVSDDERNDSRIIELIYDVTIPASAEGNIDVYLPIAQSNAQQDVLSYVIDSTMGASKTQLESVYNNRFWHIAHQARGQEEKVTVRYKVRRRVFSNDKIEQSTSTYSAEELESFGRFLKANKRVPIDGTMVSDINAGLVPNAKRPLEIAKASYDYVVDSMEYKKVGRGWGNGDTYWACSEKYGNCTDFHALFTSLVRARGIPARFEIGFPIPEDKNEGVLGGYHCWLSFYLPGAGWVPIDASEAKKHPEKRALFFGTHPADRIAFSVGRDLELGQKSGALNYFVFPLVEKEGQKLEGVKTEVRYSSP